MPLATNHAHIAFGMVQAAPDEDDDFCYACGFFMPQQSAR